MKANAYFENIQKQIILELKSAKESVRIAMAYFTDYEVFDVLCNLAKDNINIELLLSTDDRNFKLNFPKLLNNKGNIFFYDVNKCLMHNKFCIIDNKTLLQGSYNWTHQNNKENLLVIHNENEIINKYLNEFEILKCDTIHCENQFFNNSTIQEILENYINKLVKNNYNLTEIFSGFLALDSITKGWQNSDLIIVAARPSMGVTSFLISNLIFAAKNKVPCALITYQQKALTISQRILSIESSIEISNLKSGHLSKNDWIIIEKEFPKIAELPIFIDDSTSDSLQDLVTKCRKLKYQNDIKLIAIDSIQFIKVSEKESFYKVQKEQEFEYIVRELKKIARELDVPILLSYPVMRAAKSVDNQNPSTPKVSDIPYMVESNADIVLFIDRPYIYGVDIDDEYNPTKGIAEIIIAKHRNGATGKVRLQFVDELAKFTDIDDELYQPSEGFSDMKQTFSSKMKDEIIDPLARDYKFDSEAPF